MITCRHSQDFATSLKLPILYNVKLEDRDAIAVDFILIKIPFRSQIPALREKAQDVILGETACQ